MNRFPPKVTEQLKFYVYLYIDPRTGQPFYIGKGKGNRAFSHLNEVKESDKVQLIKEIRNSGYEPRIELLKYGLIEQDAVLVEDQKKGTCVEAGNNRLIFYPAGKRLKPEQIRDFMTEGFAIYSTLKQANQA